MPDQQGEELMQLSQGMFASVAWDRLMPNFLDLAEMYNAVKFHKEQIQQATKLHREQLNASLLMHNHELGAATKMHRQEVKVNCALHDREKEMALGMHNVELQVELLHSSCENIRDTAEQFIEKVSTFLLVETLLLGSLFVVLIEAQLPLATQQEMPWLVIVYSASSGLAFLLLSVALWLTFAVQERILKFRRHALGGAFRAFKIHREHWTQSMEKLRDFYFRLESERESVTKTFDDDMQGIAGLVARAGFTFCVGVLGLGLSVVCVVTAKLIVGFEGDDGIRDPAYAAAYLFVAICGLTVFAVGFLMMREWNKDVLRPTVSLKGDYCVLTDVKHAFLDAGAQATDQRKEGGEEYALTHKIQYYISYESSDGMALLPEFTHKDTEGRVKPKPKRTLYQPATACAKVDSWIPIIPGMYIITYIVRDDDGNEGFANRTVLVMESNYENDDSEFAPASPVGKFELRGDFSDSDLSRSPSKGEDLDVPDSGPQLYGPLASRDKTTRTFQMRGSRHRLSVTDLTKAFQENSDGDSRSA